MKIPILILIIIIVMPVALAFYPAGTNTRIGYQYFGNSFATGLYQILPIGPQPCTYNDLSDPAYSIHVLKGHTYDLVMGAINTEVLAIYQSQAGGDGASIFNLEPTVPQTLKIINASWNPTLLYSAFGANPPSGINPTNDQYATIRITPPITTDIQLYLNNICSIAGLISSPSEGNPGTGFVSYTAGIHPTITNRLGGSCGTCQPFVTRTPTSTFDINYSTDVTGTSITEEGGGAAPFSSYYTPGSVHSDDENCGNYTANLALWQSNCGGNSTADSYSFTWNWSSVYGPKSISFVHLVTGYNANPIDYNISFFQANGTRIWLGQLSVQTDNSCCHVDTFYTWNLHSDCPGGICAAPWPSSTDNATILGSPIDNVVAIRIVSWSTATFVTPDWFDIQAGSAAPVNELEAFNATVTPPSGFIGGYPVDPATCFNTGAGCNNVSLMVFDESIITDNAQPQSSVACFPDPQEVTIPDQATIYINVSQTGSYYSELFKLNSNGLLSPVSDSPPTQLISSDNVHFIYTYPSNRQSMVFGNINDTGSYVLAVTDNQGSVIKNCRFQIDGAGIIPPIVNVDGTQSSIINASITNSLTQTNDSQTSIGTNDASPQDTNFIYQTAAAIYSNVIGIPAPFFWAMVGIFFIPVYQYSRRRLIK